MSHICPEGHKHGETSTCRSKHGCTCEDCVVGWRRRWAEESVYLKKRRAAQGLLILVPSPPYSRMLQALAVNGWSSAVLAEEVDAHPRALTKVRAAEKPSVNIKTARKVRYLFEKYSMQMRDSRAGRVTRSHAINSGWISAMDWADIERGILEWET